MGCLRLTYDNEPNLFLQEQEEKVEAVGLRVWINPDGVFSEVGINVLAQGGPRTIDGMLFNSNNPYLYSPTAYFKYDLGTEKGQIVRFSPKGIDVIYIGGKEGNEFQGVDLKTYTSNQGFTQIPRDLAKESVFEALGSFAEDFWRTFTNGNGYLVTDKPFTAAMQNLRGSPYSDVTFRFITNFNFDKNNYHVVLNVNY